MGHLQELVVVFRGGADDHLGALACRDKGAALGRRQGGGVLAEIEGRTSRKGRGRGHVPEVGRADDGGSYGGFRIS